MSTPHGRENHESLWETFSRNPYTSVVGAAAMVAVSAATKGASLGNLARAGASAMLAQTANVMLDNHKQDNPHAGALMWLGTSMAGSFALNMTKPGAFAAERAVGALADAQIGALTGFAAKSLMSQADSLPAKLGIGVAVSAVGGALGSTANLGSATAPDALAAMRTGAVEKVQQRVAVVSGANVGARVDALSRDGQTQHPARHPAQPQQPSGPVHR